VRLESNPRRRLWLHFGTAARRPAQYEQGVRVRGRDEIPTGVGPAPASNPLLI